MKANLSTNRELKNYSKEDSFDFMPKAEAIKSFLEFNLESLKENKMIALYGDWGSGKTSLMKHIEKEINKDIYFPIFFHAWEHEKDDNLALSLCDAITSSLKGEISQTLYEFKRIAVNILKGFTSGISVKLGHEILGGEISFEGSKLIDELEKANKEKKHHSFFSKNKEFKGKFIEVEKLILKNSNSTKIIVFVDDLDRCEPENVLNLITALKLFFTYGENTIFLAGLDKEAVAKAVKTKYNDVVKSEEYLEKVFDITFSMPKMFSLEKYFSNYFNSSINVEDEQLLYYSNILSDFFSSIHFTTPRHIKKVLNKYEILRTFRDNDEIPNEIRNLVPNIVNKNGEGDIFETIFCFFFIILYENHPELFSKIEYYNQKISNFIEPYRNGTSTSNDAKNDTIARNLYYMIGIDDVKTKTINELLHQPRNADNSDSFIPLIFVFSTDEVELLSYIDEDELYNYKDYFMDKSILTLFCNFLIKHKKSIMENKFSEYIFWDYFKMAKYLL